jgi:hypothetical protein
MDGQLPLKRALINYLVSPKGDLFWKAIDSSGTKKIENFLT